MNNKDETPLVQGGQGRSGSSLKSDAVTVGFALVGALLLMVWSVWSCQ